MWNLLHSILHMEDISKQAVTFPSQPVGQWISSNIPTLNFAKNAKFRMGHPACFHLRRLQVTLSAAKLGARVGASHEKARPGGICLGINRRADRRTHRLAWQNARQHPQEHP